MKKGLSYFSDDDDDEDALADEIRLVQNVSPGKGIGHIVVGSAPATKKGLLNKQKPSSVTPVTRSSYTDDDLDDEYGFPIINNQSDEDNDSVDSHASKSVGIVGMKWRTRVMRVLDSEEQWKGICEIYFHWNSDKETAERGMRKRKKKKLSEKEKYSITNIEQPDKCPVFIILNEEDSNSIEEMYYTMPGFPDMMFGYLQWTVVVHERLELEVLLL